MRSSLREPGMGRMKSFLCSIQANEIWAGVTHLQFAKSVIRASELELVRFGAAWTA
jgi:hypothetical protein